MNWTNHKAALSLMYDGPQRLFTISYNVGFKPTQQERKDISNLVGSAPALLEALEAILDDVEGYGLAHPEGGRFECDHNDIARAAIAAAKGGQ